LNIPKARGVKFKVSFEKKHNLSISVGSEIHVPINFSRMK
jgi:hypothetical protein